MLHGGTLTNPPSKAGIEGFAKGLSQIASVADATARAALVSGLTVTAANPVWVYRQDTGDVEVTTNGTTWRAVPTGPKSSAPLTPGTGWIASTGSPTVYRDGGWAWLNAIFSRQSGSDPMTTIPAGYRPAAPITLPCTTLNLNNTVGPPMYVDISSTTGVVVPTIMGGGPSFDSTTYVVLHATPYRVAG